LLACRLYVLAAAVVAASTIVVVAAHGSSNAGVPAELKLMHDGCTQTGPDGQTQSHIPADLAQKLELTSQQSADIDRLAAEGCATILRTHQQILDLLTPEQRAKIQQMHSDGSAHAYLYEMFKKLHGGK
jgi:Spy/CpxP family protein refolding chaperone